MVHISQKLFLTLYEQLIIGFMPMNFYILTNYFKMMDSDIISYDIDNSKVLLFLSELVTRKFYFCLLFRVSDSEILLFFCFFRLVTQKFYFNLLFRVSNSKILICLFNSS